MKAKEVICWDQLWSRHLHGKRKNVRYDGHVLERLQGNEIANSIGSFFLIEKQHEQL